MSTTGLRLASRRLPRLRLARLELTRLRTTGLGLIGRRLTRLRLVRLRLARLRTARLRATGSRLGLARLRVAGLWLAWSPLPRLRLARLGRRMCTARPRTSRAWLAGLLTRFLTGRARLASAHLNRPGLTGRQLVRGPEPPVLRPRTRRTRPLGLLGGLPPQLFDRIGPRHGHPAQRAVAVHHVTGASRPRAVHHRHHSRYFGVGATGRGPPVPPSQVL
ncbi:hypothetical protein [Actinophytocola sediminis]